MLFCNSLLESENCAFYLNLTFVFVHLYKSQKMCRSVQHFGVQDCIHSEGIFYGVKNTVKGMRVSRPEGRDAWIGNVYLLIMKQRERLSPGNTAKGQRTALAVPGTAVS